MTVSFFTDDPMIRSKVPAAGHEGHFHYMISDGFCTSDAGNPNTNSNGDTSSTMRGGANGSGSQEFLVKTPLPVLRPNEKCVNATLEIWATETVDDAMILSLHDILVDWNHTEATYNEKESGIAWAAAGLLAGTDYTAVALASGTVGSLKGSPVLSFDVSAWIAGACDGSVTNYGFILKGDAGQANTQKFWLGAEFFQQKVRLVIETAFVQSVEVNTDTYIDQLSPTRYGYNDLFVSIRNSVILWKDTGLFEWSLTGVIPSNGSLVSGDFLFRGFAGGILNETLTIHGMLTEWIDTQAHWTERKTGVAWASSGMLAGTDYEAVAAASFNPALIHVSSFVTVDIKELIAKWITGEIPNYGFCLIMPGTNNNPQSIDSKKSGTAANRPQLVLQWQT